MVVFVPPVVSKKRRKAKARRVRRRKAPGLKLRVRGARGGVMRKGKAVVLVPAKSQIGKSNIARDKKLIALRPGKRRSRRGKIYYERRANRSDREGVPI
ncbi:MAG: hypothetical protein QXQ33_00735 [Nitrososphaerota archaeon]